MAIPAQVRQRSMQADDLIKAQAAGQPMQDADNSAQSNEQTNDTQSEPESTAASEEVSEEVSREVPPTDVAARLASIEEEMKQAKQRNNTLQGMIRSEQQENARLRTLLAQLDGQQETKKPADDAPKQSSQQDPSETADRQEFGDDFVDMVLRAVDRKLQQVLTRLDKVESTTQQTAESAAITQEERFHQRLLDRVPNWREIDVTDEFREWLHASRTRVDIVRRGMAHYDANAVAEIFELYIQLTGKGSEEKKETPKTPAGQEKLQRQVAPPKGRTSKTTEPDGRGDKKVWTRTEIAQVFNSRRNMKPAEFKALEQEIFAAQKEGRVDHTR